jgi:DNA polymerase-3 subunit gamma/tau
MAVLYRTYRPQVFAEVVGQKFIIRTLQNAVKTGKLAHAYLLCGSRGVGKTSIARILAKAANCTQLKDGDACGVCANCTAITNNNFLDLIEIDAASNTGVDNVRELIEHVRFQPSQGTHKVFIIDEVHMLSKGAFNALLKTLEEPPAHAIFILATTEIHKVPQTIITRTQRFTFGRLTLPEIEDHLAKVAKQEKITIEKEALSLIARYSEGSLRDALSLLGKVATLGGKITTKDTAELLGVTTAALSAELIDLIIDKNTSALPDFFDRQLEQGTDFTLFNKDFLDYLRLLLVFSVSGAMDQHFLTPEQAERAIEQSKTQSSGGWMFVIRLFLRSLKEVTISPMPELPMLLAALEACGSQPQKPDNKQVAPAQSSAPVATINQPEARLEIPKQEPPVIHSEQATGLDDILTIEVEQFWPKVIDNIKVKNSPLATLLKNSPIVSTEKGVITLRVKYLFHKEHLENVKNQGLVQSAVLTVAGKNVRVKASLVKDEPDAKDSAEVLRDALQVFGGELVE